MNIRELVSFFEDAKTGLPGFNENDKLLFAMESFEHGFKQFPGVWSLRILENFS